jgi:hypothetical protein
LAVNLLGFPGRVREADTGREFGVEPDDESMRRSSLFRHQDSFHRDVRIGDRRKIEDHQIFRA